MDAPTPTSFEQLPRASLRILCLHDAESDAVGLKSQIAVLGEKLYTKHGIDLIYINSPILNVHKERRWYDDTEDTTVWEASLVWLEQAWRASSCHGLLGVGQGALMAHALMERLAEDASFPPQFVLVAARSASLPPTLKMGTIHFTVPILHILRDADQCTSAEQFLIDHHDAMNTHNCRGQSTTKLFNVMGRFCCDQQRRCRGTIAIHTALRQVEDISHDAIATTIAAKPPKSLLAVIQPKRMALPNQRATAPLAGAPCPSISGKKTNSSTA